MVAKRSDYFGAWFMQETTKGVDPGIVEADVTEATSPSWMAKTDRKAFARLALPPDGLPSLEMHETPQTFQTNDFEACFVKGLRSEGEVTLTFNLTGPAFDGTTERPVAPPWLQLAGSACGELIGFAATQVGGKETEIATGASGSEFTLDADADRVMSDGMVMGVNLSTGLELLRVTEFDGVGVDDASIPLSATPSVEDAVYLSTAAAFDKRLEGQSKSFTILLQRPETDSTVMLLGAQATSWEITSNFGEFATIAITFLYTKWSSFNDAAVDSHLWTATPTIVEEPSYYDVWPCAKIVTGAKFVYQDPTDDSFVRDLHIAGLSVSWNSGLTRRGANTGAEGVADVLASQRSEFRFTFTCLYKTEWRSFLEACCDSNVANVFPVHYWEGNQSGHVWFVALAAAHLVQDPGFNGEFEGNQAQEIVLGLGKYDWDDSTNSWTGNDFTDTKFVIGVL